MNRYYEEPQRVRVIYRTWNDGEGEGVIALMPEEPSDILGNHCQSYEHIGQHGGASPYHVIRATRPATGAEVAELEAELRQIGYEPVRIYRLSQKMWGTRKETLNGSDHTCGP